MSWFDPQYTELYGSEPSLSDLLPPSPASTISSNVQTEHGFPSDQFRPLNFHEWVVALNAIWQKYRVEADRVYDLGVIELTNREQKAYPYPRTGLIDIRGDQPREPYSPKEFSSMFQSKFFKISTTTEELFDPNSAPRIRQRYWEAKHYFEWVAGTGTTTIADGYLGYGHRGLAIKATHRGPGQEHPRDYVIKVDHRSWESAAIRREKKALKHVLGAAHCVQMIHESTLGIYDGHDFEFELPRRDDSSDLGDSSGMSSAADQPPPARPTRRQRLEDDADAVFDIREAHTDMVDEAIEWHKTRRKYVEEHGPDLSDDDPYDTNRKDFILMEFVPHGNLAHMIYGLVDNNERVPNRVLWSFWLCLIKACIALEYPVRKFHPMRYGDPRWDPTNPPSSTKAGKSTWKAIGDDLFEDVPPPSRRWAGKRMVHFDIDPRNILIGGLDPTAEDGEHTLIPRLKLADFGFAERIKPDKINAYYMNRRGTGKYGYFTPEQFARDWDYVEQPIEDGPEISEQRVAGAYGSPTNVYGIALVLWILMTLCSPPLPPRQNPVDPNNPDEPVHYAPLILDDPQFNYIDPELRITISHCLRHYPDERPLLADLLGQARRGTSKEFPGESDDVIRDWVQRNIYNAPPRPNIWHTIADGDDPGAPGGGPAGQGPGLAGVMSGPSGSVPTHTGQNVAVAGPSIAGPSGAGSSVAGPSGTNVPTAGPSGINFPTAGLSKTGSSVAGPSGTNVPTAGPSGINFPTAGLSKTGSSVAGPSGTNFPTAGPWGDGSSMAGSSVAGSFVAAPSGTNIPTAGPSGTNIPTAGPWGGGSSVAGSSVAGSFVAGSFVAASSETNIPVTGPSGSGSSVAGPSGTNIPTVGPWGSGSSVAGSSVAGSFVAAPSGTNIPVAGPSGSGSFVAGPSGTNIPTAGPSGTNIPTAGPWGDGSSMAGSSVAGSSVAGSSVAGPSGTNILTAGPSGTNIPTAGPWGGGSSVAGSSVAGSFVAAPSETNIPVAGPSGSGSSVAGPSGVNFPVGGHPISGPSGAGSSITGNSGVDVPMADAPVAGVDVLMADAPVSGSSVTGPSSANSPTAGLSGTGSPVLRSSGEDSIAAGLSLAGLSIAGPPAIRYTATGPLVLTYPGTGPPEAGSFLAGSLGSPTPKTPHSPRRSGFSRFIFGSLTRRSKSSAPPAPAPLVVDPSTTGPLPTPGPKKGKGGRLGSFMRRIKLSGSRDGSKGGVRKRTKRFFDGVARRFRDG